MVVVAEFSSPTTSASEVKNPSGTRPSALASRLCSSWAAEGRFDMVYTGDFNGKTIGKP